jgi:hypothetical protein
MTLSNDPHPSDDNRPDRETPRPDDDKLSFPSAPRASYNRMLVDTYLRNCRRGFKETYNLITAPSRMTYEDRVVLQRMESQYRAVFKDKLKDFGLADKASELTVRVLHPVVAIGEGERKYHLYVDVVSRGGRSWFLDFDAGGVFETGPASMQLTSLGKQGQMEQVLFTRIFSVPAFNEAMNKLVVASFPEVLSQHRDFIAFGWIMQAISLARSRAASRLYGEDAQTSGPFRLDSVENFHWTGGKRPFTFECSVENAWYTAHVGLDPRRREPVVVLHGEVF